MRRPKPLVKGDSVILLSTARKISQIEVGYAIEIYRSWGLNIILGHTIGLSVHQYAGSDAMRAADLQQAMDNQNIKAIFCARGGYGTVRILDHIDFGLFCQTPKWIVGYSDVSILHAHINSYLGIETLHASMPVNFETNSTEALSSLQKALFGQKYTLKSAPHKLNRKGQAKASIIGGNLSILYSIIGTHSGIRTDGYILFIEDVDEYLYHIDRMMQKLSRAGKLAQIAGLIVGGMTSIHDNKIPFGKTAQEIIYEYIAPYNFPVCFDFPAGHIDDNRALILGREIELKIDETGGHIQF